MTSKVICPWCLSSWWGMEALARHAAKRHHPCRFCPRSQIRVDNHERLTHTAEYAAALR